MDQGLHGSWGLIKTQKSSDMLRSRYIPVLLIEDGELTKTKESALPTQLNKTKLTIKQKLLEIKSEIKKLSAVKQILFAVGAALAVACCAVAVAGTGGLALIPLAVIGGLAGATILSGAGVQIAQNTLGNPEKAEEAKQTALADLAQFKKDFDKYVPIIKREILATKELLLLRKKK